METLKDFYEDLQLYEGNNINTFFFLIITYRYYIIMPTHKSSDYKLSAVKYYLSLHCPYFDL